MLKRVKLLPCLVFFAMAGFSIPPQANAQQLLGGITGNVTDSSGALVPQVEAKVVNGATGFQQTTFTNSSGSYQFFDLPIGTYSVTFTKQGFKTEVHSEVLVQGNRTTTVDAVLQPGGATTTVTVTATPLLNSTDTTVGYVLGPRVIEAIPLGTGSFTQLATLSPGVNADFLNESGTNGGLGNQEIWANGQRDTSNSISFNAINADNLFNGKTSSSVSSNRFVLSTGEQGVENPNGQIVTSTSVYNAIGQGLPTPPPETIEELRVNTAMYDTSQGSKSGAHIEVITKSGTNDFHGQAYEYFQNSALNAAPFFYNAAGLETPALHRNTFGVTLGGPIKRDKMFFFASYQGIRLSDQLNGTKNNIVPLKLTNDRSAATLAQEFNISDPTQIDPAALALLNFKDKSGNFLIPSPNIDPATAQRIGYDLVVQGAPATLVADQLNGNIDYNFSSKDRLAAKYFYQRDPTTNPFAEFAELRGFPQVLRAGSQAINIFNHPSFDTPNNNVSFNAQANNPPLDNNFNVGYQFPPAGQLGLIQHTLGSPRFIQMTLHLVF